jgi:hypothetical protein
MNNSGGADSKPTPAREFEGVSRRERCAGATNRIVKKHVFVIEQERASRSDLPKEIRHDAI